jgi:hypothetical protein
MQGASPRHENFKKFLVTKGGLRVIFDPYAEGGKQSGVEERPLVPLGRNCDRRLITGSLITAQANLLIRCIYFMRNPTGGFPNPFEK